MSVMGVFSERLKALREGFNLKQAELAEQLGVSRGSISFYENGDRVPDINFLFAVASFFGVTFDYLLGTSNAPEKELADVAAVTRLLPDAVNRLIEIGNNSTAPYFSALRGLETLLLSEGDLDISFLRSLFEFTHNVVETTSSTGEIPPYLTDVQQYPGFFGGKVDKEMYNDFHLLRLQKYIVMLKTETNAKMLKKLKGEE